MRYCLIVDRPEDWPEPPPTVTVRTAADFLGSPDGEAARIYNLCRSLRYQSNGYYVSLLASARGLKVVPDIATVQDLKSPALARLISADETARIQASLAPLQGHRFELSIYFGQSLAARHARLARTLYNRCPTPLLRALFHRRDGLWELDQLRALALDDVPPDHRDALHAAASTWFGKRRQGPARRQSRPYDLAMLVNEAERDPPSNAGALAAFETAAAQAGFNVTRIGREDYGEVAEYDALFIRETTFVNHHSYRIARRAALEGLVVIDDPDSILRCTNKVFLAERLARAGIPCPDTCIVHRDNVRQAGETLGFPLVLKQPDSAFSRGVVKLDNAAALKRAATRLLRGSDLLVAQAYTPTDYDWRVGVLNGRALYLCRYYMAPEHWQIVRHQDDGAKSEGDATTLDVSEAPPGLLRAAERAANAMGRGLYGVDIKQVGRRYLVIEVNDNPSIDAGVEDGVLGAALYQTVMDEFRRRVEARRDG